MSVDPHWLKNQFKGTNSAELIAELDQLEAFGGSVGMMSMIQAELDRREKEMSDER